MKNLSLSVLLLLAGGGVSHAAVFSLSRLWISIFVKTIKKQAFTPRAILA